MVDLRLFRHPVFSAGLGAATLAYLAMFVLIFALPFYLMRVMGLDTRVAGLLLTTTPLAMAVFAPVAGKMADRLGHYGLSTAGLLAMTAGLVAASFFTPHTSFIAIILTLGLIGSGMATFQTPNTAAVLAATPHARAGVGSAFIAEARNIGMSIGIALTAAILVAAMGGAMPGGDGTFASAAADSFVAGMALALRVGAVLTLIAAGLSWFVRVDLRHGVEPQGEGA
jgi:MFS family permease